MAHVHQVFGVGAYAPEQAEHRLDKQRPLGQAPAVKMGQIVQVGDVVAFEFEPRTVLIADR